jgi:hypothetical protein
MRAAEIVGCDVYDKDGIHIGRVHDLRFEQTPSTTTGVSWYRLTGFECGAAPLGHRLGYERTAMAGPWLLRALFRRLERRAVLVDWQNVASFKRPRIDLNTGREALQAISESYQ